MDQCCTLSIHKRCCRCIDCVNSANTNIIILIDEGKWYNKRLKNYWLLSEAIQTHPGRFLFYQQQDDRYFLQAAFRRVFAITIYIYKHIIEFETN